MKISVVTPTTPARLPFLIEAAKLLAAQDYRGDVEWIVLDELHSSMPARLAFPCTYALAFGAPTTGAKRNMANDLATGEIIVHWDDDDWYHPHRLTDQIEFFLQTGKSVSGYHSILYWRRADQQGFKYDDPTFRPHAAGASLVYTREFWANHKFENKSIGEDFFFCMKARNLQQLSSKDGRGFMVAQVHGGNTCYPNFGSNKFPNQPKSNFPSEFLLTLD